ncbi:MAG: GTP-binding protein [Planctomycetes bacterium]|nr:GTP-binding protein [Planctomycetota bacterium]
MPDQRISTSLLTGFLGSGKTTILNALLRDPATGETAVIVNEFGEISLDHLLVENATEEMIVLESGCVCCSVRNDLLETMRDLWEKRERGEIPRFERLLIETTGLADPAPILRTLIHEIDISEHFFLDSVLCAIDLFNLEETLEARFESRKQVAVADRLLLTKFDLLERELGSEAAHACLVELEQKLWDLNPSAPHVVAQNGAIAPRDLFGVALERGEHVDAWLRDDAFEATDEDESDHDHAPGHAHGHEIRSFCLTYDEPIPLRVFEAWVTSLLHFQGPRLLRVKGIVHVREVEKPTVLHIVQHAFHDPIVLDAWPDADRRTRIVFITVGLEREGIEASLRHLLDHEIE